MAEVKDLTELGLGDLWREAKGEDDWWGDLKAQTLRLVKRLLESAMEEEILEALRAGRYRRTRSTSCRWQPGSPGSGTFVGWPPARP